MNTNATPDRMDSTGRPDDAAAAIGHSVKMFRVFEILRGGDVAAVDKLIRQHSSIHLEGTSILHLAVQCAEPKVVEQILTLSHDPNLEIEVNSQDREGNTPLHLASMLGRAALVYLFLAEKTTDSSTLNYQSQSALDVSRNSEIFQQLQLDRAMFTESKVQEVHRYVARGDYNRLERLLGDTKVQVVLDINGGELASESNTVDSGGSLLHEAARRRDLKLIQMLLLNGADPFRRDRKGKLPQDVTKDDKTRSILKRSPAATAARGGIQEKAILGSYSADKSLACKDSREMKGYLKKWTNYTTGYKLRWFVLEDGVLSYYKHQGTLSVISPHSDPSRGCRLCLPWCNEYANCQTRYGCARSHSIRNSWQILRQIHPQGES